MVAGVGVMVKVWLAPAVHRHRAGRIDLAVGSGRGGDGVGVDGEAGGDGVVGGDVGEGVAAVTAPTETPSTSTSATW